MSAGQDHSVFVFGKANCAEFILVCRNISCGSLDSVDVSKIKHFVVVKKLLLKTVELDFILICSQISINKLHTFPGFSSVVLRVKGLNDEHNREIVIFLFL